MTLPQVSVAGVVDEGGDLDLARHIIEFDPRRPDHYLFAAAPSSLDARTLAVAALHPDPIPWPAGQAPVLHSLTPAPAATDPIPAADILVVTYTVAEGYALADVLTPGVDTSAWTEYKSNWPALKAMIQGHRAPALGYGRAGLWSTTTIGDTTVVVFKSDLHPSTDGPNLPMHALWAQLITQARPELVLTTGTAGGVGADTQLGDVIVSCTVTWDCTNTFARAPFAHAQYHSTLPLPANDFTEAAETLIPVNATHLPPAARSPRVWRDTIAHAAHTLTTDFFAFDDTADHYGLRGYDPKARAVEMDDAALGLALASIPDPPRWVSVRNASDPQMTGTDLAAEKRQAAAIYEEYGYWTSIGSAITCWALIAARGGHRHRAGGTNMGRVTARLD